jgi:methylmalonyl-CoA mutase C-terminal domain/subunit
MREKGLNDVLLSGGGIISKEDMEALRAMGVGDLFGPGTPTGAIIDYVRGWVAANRTGKIGSAS